MTPAARLGAYRTLLDALQDAPAGAPFVTMWNTRGTPEEDTVTFGQFMDRAAGYAELYRARGVQARDTVVLVMDQSIALLAAFAGALLAGAVPTILAYPTFKVDPEKYRSGLAGVTRNLEARLLVIDEAFPSDLEAHLDGHAVLRLPQMPPPRDVHAWAFPAPQPDDVAFIQHSAGTTGLQKGVALSHRAVLTHLRTLAPVLELRDTDRIVSWLPLYHDMGLIACFVLPLAAHLPLIMVSPTDWVLWPGSLLRLASAHRCTLCWLPNFAFQFLARRVPERDRIGLDLSSLRAVINCSEPVRAEGLEEFARVYAASGLSRGALASSYAMAENTFAVTQSAAGIFPTTLWVTRAALAAGRLALVDPHDADARPLTSSGRCLPSTELRIVTAAGAPMPDGAVGHVILRSPSLFDGYYRRPDLTDRALRDGWYWTGDTGVVWHDEAYILGRHDDVIIVAGKNLYPQDLEEIVSLHPRIHDGRVVALGAFNPEMGTEDLIVVAEVQAEDDLGRAAEIQAEIRQQILGEVGVAPRVVHLVPPKWIVKSTAGKPARAATRQKLVKERPELDRGR